MYGFTFNLQRFAVFDNSTNDTIIAGTAGTDIADGDEEFLPEIDPFGGDTITNSDSNVSISGTAGNDTITNSGSNVTIVGGSATNNVIVYNEGDGNDTIYGLDSKTTLQIASGNLKSVTSIQAIRPKS